MNEKNSSNLIAPDILDAIVKIHHDGVPSEKDKAFLTRQLVQVTFPHSNPGNVPIWKRTNGNLTLSIRPGWDHSKKAPHGYPYGSIPRLLLFWITTEALRTKSRKLELGESLSSFMKDIGLNPSSGGKRGDIQRLKQQMKSLFRAIISLEIVQKTENSINEAWLDMQIAPEGKFWEEIKNNNKNEVFGSWIELSEKFYEAIIAAPVPLDKRVIKILKNSSLALDIYAWSTYKNYSLIQQNKEEQFISWISFMAQLGENYSDFRSFKKKVKIAFKKIISVYPGLIIRETRGGFIVRKGLTSIPIVPSKIKNK